MTSLSSTARSAIVSTYITALNTAENTGALVTQVCDVANKYTKGESLSDDDMVAIIGGIARERGWKGPALKTRSSEVRVVLKAAHTLPEAIKGFHHKAGKCDWHTSMKLARCINRGEKVKDAISHTFANKSQSTKSTPQGRTAAGLKAWFAVAKADKKIAITKAAELLGIRL